MNKLGRYIERNLVVAGIDGIENPEDYKWSSAVITELFQISKKQVGN